MADPRRDLHPDGPTDSEAGVGPHGGSPPATPRWVKVFGIVALVLVVLFVIVHLAGGGLGRHG